MKYALVGCGRIAINHLTAALNNQFEIAGLCDLRSENIKELMKKAGVKVSVPVYTDYRRLIEEARPELVAIATESGKHAAIALDCIDAGCHVIIEKPIALSLEEADEIIRRAKKKGVKVCTCHQNRFNQSIQHMRQALEEGRLGKLSHGSIHVRWNRNKDYYDQANWRGTWAQDGGVLMNQSIHGIDLLRWMMGDEIEEIFAYTANQFHPYLECEDVGLAVVRFKSGALGTIEGTSNVYPRNLEETLYLFGEKGTMKAGGKSANTIEVWEFADERPEDKQLKSGLVEQTVNVYGNGHTRLYKDMQEAILQDRSPYVDGAAGRRALEVVLAIYKSAKEGKPVKLPLSKCSTLDFVE
ncbi:MAG: Gfo/Idh/MocA family oxidoreductase [Peptococcaceae bacterium]|nr:Gfo/Idh/MocA family oxidoreductase [Peptococcaceae bacterium]